MCRWFDQRVKQLCDARMLVLHLGVFEFKTSVCEEVSVREEKKYKQSLPLAYHQFNYLFFNPKNVGRPRRRRPSAGSQSRDFGHVVRHSGIEKQNT